MDAGADFTCAIDVGGSVRCWGEGGSGQLGAGTTADSTTPMLAMGVSGANGVATGARHACALDEVSGALWCWGDNRDGQLGNGTMTSSSVPVRVSGW